MQRSGQYQDMTNPYVRGADSHEPFYLDVDFNDSKKPRNPNFGAGPSNPNFGPMGPSDPNFGPAGPWNPNFGPMGPRHPNFGSLGPRDPNFGRMGPRNSNFGPMGHRDSNFGPIHRRGPYYKPTDPRGSMEEHCKPVSAEKIIDGVVNDEDQNKVVEEDEVQESVEDDDDDVPLPDELLNMLQKRKCELCPCVLPNPSQAEDHYTATMHFRKVKRFLIAWCEREKKEMHPSWWSLVRGYRNANAAKLPRDGSAEMCKICNINYFQSVFHARLHYRGKQHEKAVEKYLEKYPNANVVTKASLQRLVCDICNLKVTKVASFEGHLKGKKHMKNVERWNQAQEAEKMKMQAKLTNLEKKVEDNGND